MHDLKWIRENPTAFDAGLARRGLSEQSEAILALDEKRRDNTHALQEMQARRNAASKDIGKAKAQAKGGPSAEADALMAKVAGLKDDIAALENAERAFDAQMLALLAGIPNLPNDDVPEGKDETGNVKVREWGVLRDFAAEGFEPKQHFEIGEALGLMDFEAAAKISGARFTVLKGGIARLERALGQFMIDLHTSAAHHTQHGAEVGGYLEVMPPILVRDHAMFGTAQLPKFEEDQFWAMSGETLSALAGAQAGDAVDLLSKIKTERFGLVPTAEVPLTNLVRESILSEVDLPYRFTALTPCFRAEAGAAGRDTRGMIRQHQFWKVELVSITTPEQSAAEHERMTLCAEEVLKRLELPYRTMVLCTGDMGFGARKTYDIEVWLPGQGAYREISSCSVCGDFQARRMNARFRPTQGKDIRFVHTLNGSGLALGRTLVAVLENYQEKDGSVRIPDALKPYMGGLERVGVPKEQTK